MPQKAKSAIKSLPRHERRAEMLRIAAELFGEQGFYATNMDDVAARCGIAKPMLYSYFGNKKGLYKAVISKLSKDVTARVEALLDIEDPEIRLEQTTLTLRTLLLTYNKVWLQARDMARSDDEIAKLVDHFRNAIIDVQSKTYADLRPAGLDFDMARIIVTPYIVAIMGAAESASEWWLKNPDLDLALVNRFSDHLAKTNRRAIREAMEAAAKGIPPAKLD